MIERLRPLALIVSAAVVVASCGGSGPDIETALGGDTTRVDASRNSFGLPALGLTNEERRTFEIGDSFFTQNWVTAPSTTDARDGLGPIFNARACASCHVLDGRGAPPDPTGETVNLGLLLRLSIPITVSLLASLFVALIFVPLAIYLTLPARGGGRPNPFSEAVRGGLRRAYDQSFGRLDQAYNKLLAFALHRRTDLVMLAILAVALTIAWPVQQLEIGAFQEDERGGFEIDVDLPQTTTLDESSEHFLKVEKILEAKQQEWDIQTYLVINWRDGGEIQGWFNTPRNNEITAREIVEELTELMPERAGAKLFTGLEDADEDKKKDLQIYRMVGDDSAQLEQVATDLEDLLQTVPGVLGVKRAGERPAQEMAVQVDRERSQRLGINPQAVAGVVRNSIGGRALPKFYRDGREIPVRVRYQEEDRESLSQVWDFRVPTGVGELVSLASVTSTERLDSPGRISRTNKQVSRTITLELEEGDEKATRKRLETMIKNADLPEGVRFGNPRRGTGQVDEVKALAMAVGLSVVFIYLLMGFLFESFILPLSIVTTIPLAILGVIWTHFLTGVQLDLLGYVGIVLLIGVVVNNGIVLVDYVNRLREEGRSRDEAVLTAAYRRFRPIMMTALTTICGMVPLILGPKTSLGISYTSFGVGLMGGMAVATLLTLLVVPVAYTLFDDLRL
ncbi:MAG: efflux RND transporter permease subunit, partial [Acidobacteriota bacterium]